MHVLVHGGAGASPADRDAVSPRTVTRELDAAADAGVARDEPAGAVVAAVRHLESSPPFNAGVGSAVQSDGRVRTDAGFVTGDGTCGAACAMPGIEHAVDVARGVATETPHVLVAGDRAVALADALGVETDCDLWTDRTRERWNGVTPPAVDDVGAHLAWVREHFGGTDTVGAVATDGKQVAAATSTGGRWFALAGRVGDVPQVGAGVYAAEAGAASATGAGEAIARAGLARRVVDAIGDGDPPGRAIAGALDAFDGQSGDVAGVIATDVAGRTAQATTAEAMPTSEARRSP